MNIKKFNMNFRLEDGEIVFDCLAFKSRTKEVVVITYELSQLNSIKDMFSFNNVRYPKEFKKVQIDVERNNPIMYVFALANGNGNEEI